MGFETLKVGSENVGNLFETEKKIEGVDYTLYVWWDEIKKKEKNQLTFSPNQHMSISTTIALFSACFL